MVSASRHVEEYLEVDHSGSGLPQISGAWEADSLNSSNNDAGYQFWLPKLNLFGGNFANSDMVKAFLNSGEYRQRFGTP